MDHDEVLVTVGAIGAVLSVIFVGLRFYARRLKKLPLGLDDWLILLAVAALIATDILVVYANSVNPNGAEVASNSDPNHTYTPEDVIYTQLSYICTVLYFTIVSATKLSILLMYNRLFSVSNAFRRQVFAMSAVVGGFWIGTTVSDCLNCIPMRYVWINAHADPRYCFNYNHYWFACGIVESVIDLLVILMPVRVVWGLHLSNTRKVAVGGVFLLGLFVILSGVVKVILSYVPGSRQPDFSRTTLWTTVHCYTGIICACLPICWPVFIAVSNYRLSRLSPIASQRRYSISDWTVLSRSRKTETEGYTTGSSSAGTNTVASNVEAHQLPQFDVGRDKLTPPPDYTSNDNNQDGFEQESFKSGAKLV